MRIIIVALLISVFGVYVFDAGSVSDTNSPANLKILNNAEGNKTVWADSTDDSLKNSVRVDSPNITVEYAKDGSFGLILKSIGEHNQFVTATIPKNKFKKLLNLFEIAIYTDSKGNKHLIQLLVIDKGTDYEITVELSEVCIGCFSGQYYQIWNQNQTNYTVNTLQDSFYGANISSAPVSVTQAKIEGCTVYNTSSYCINNTGLVGWWKFDDNGLNGNKTIDSSGTGNDGWWIGNGTLNQSANWTTGKYNSGLQFDGVDDYVAVASGGTITYSGNYAIHTFNSNGTFTIPSYINVEVLVVGGGGGGGKAETEGAGAGGAGGLIYNSSFIVSPGIYNITVGNGGSGSSTSQQNGLNGGSSSFSTLVAVGGGGGGWRKTAVGSGYGNNGGSGGGGGWGGGYTGGTGVSGQGYYGGTSYVESPKVGAGGGGAGGNGTATTNGAGVSNSISGSSVTYSVGGFPYSTCSLSNEASGTGNGGDSGLSSSCNGANGGSGILIIRYLINQTSSSMWIKPISTNVWEFVAYNGSTYFKNGDVGTPTNYPLIGYTIGRNASTFFNGTIDEVRIYNRSLSSEEIRQRYLIGVQQLQVRGGTNQTLSANFNGSGSNPLIFSAADTINNLTWFVPDNITESDGTLLYNVSKQMEFLPSITILYTGNSSNISTSHNGGYYYDNQSFTPLNNASSAWINKTIQDTVYTTAQFKGNCSLSSDNTNASLTYNTAQGYLNISTGLLVTGQMKNYNTTCTYNNAPISSVSNQVVEEGDTTATIAFSATDPESNALNNTLTINGVIYHGNSPISIVSPPVGNYTAYLNTTDMNGTIGGVYAWSPNLTLWINVSGSGYAGNIQTNTSDSDDYIEKNTAFWFGTNTTTIQGTSFNLSVNLTANQSGCSITSGYTNFGEVATGTFKETSYSVTCTSTGTYNFSVAWNSANRTVYAYREVQIFTSNVLTTEEHEWLRDIYLCMYGQKTCSLSTNITNINNNLTGIISTINNINTNITQINSTLNTQNTTINSINTNLTTLTTTVSNINTNISNIYSNTSFINLTIGNTNTTIYSVNDFLSIISTNINNTNSTVQYINTTTINANSSIHTLSNISAQDVWEYIYRTVHGFA